MKSAEKKRRKRFTVGHKCSVSRAVATIKGNFY